MITFYFFTFIAAFIVAVFLLKTGTILMYAVPILRDPVFARSLDSRLETMLELADLKKGQKVIDIGSGDGTILLAVARRGLAVEGVELNPGLILLTKRTMQKAGLEHLITLYRRDFWKMKYGDYDRIFLYAAEHVMNDLEEKLMRELPQGALVVSNQFQFANWKPMMSKNNVYLYER